LHQWLYRLYFLTSNVWEFQFLHLLCQPMLFST
jgi:hypothetical protein